MSSEAAFIGVHLAAYILLEHFGGSQERQHRCHVSIWVKNDGLRKGQYLAGARVTPLAIHLEGLQPSQG